jgi:hypothetical protein
MFASIGRVLLLGIVATATMDVLTTLARKARIAAPLPPILMGRWVAGVAHGQLWHANVEQATPVSRELGIALLMHYGVGFAFAALYLHVTSQLGVSPRYAVPAISFGLATAVFPWLLMFPAMGFGWFGGRGPIGTQLFLSSLMSHAAFGVGIWLGARAAGMDGAIA